MIFLALPQNLVFVNSDDWLSLTIRLTLALLAGGAIGWNRQAEGKQAGLRNHMLVSLGAALFVLIPLMASTSTYTFSFAIQGLEPGVGFFDAG